MLYLNSIFSSNMILQARKPVRFFGTGIGEVKITLKGEERKATSDGRWVVEFCPQEYGGPYDIMVELDGVVSILKNVYFGDVFLLSGQSNMQFKLHESNEPVKDYLANPNARIFTVDRMEAGEPFSERDGWVELSLENVPEVSAIGYYIAKEMASDERKIGLIACYQGASAIQPWMPIEVAKRYPRSDANNHYPIWNENGILYDKMLSKIVPFSLSHVVWYQGESNSKEGEASLYLDMLKDFISALRNIFNDSSLPFVIVQIADYIYENNEWWHTVQEAQLLIQSSLPFVYSVPCKDICESDDIHPKSKAELSKRIVNKLLL